MALCKAMILVGTLLLVTTLGRRIKLVSEATPHQPEEMTKHAGDGAMEKTMKQMATQDQEELAEALVEQDVYQGVADEAVPRDPSDKRPRLHPGRSWLWRVSQAQLSKVSRLKPIQQGKEEEGKGKKGKDKGKGKDKDEGKDKGKDAGKDKDYKLVKWTGNGNGKTVSIFVKKGGWRPNWRFWKWGFPVLNGRWWITRLSFLREQYVGFVYQEIPSTKTLLIKSWGALEEFGGEAIIPQWGNYAGAKIGDKITFNVDLLAQEREGKPRPMAVHVIIRERGHSVGEGIVKGPALTDVRTQLLYYISDENLRTDGFFQDIIATTEGGWISTDFLLSCQRMKQLGASTKSIIKSLRDVPGVEVRDLPGQEAVRRASPPPPLEPGAVTKLLARLSAKVRNGLAKKSVEAPVLGKQIYTKEMLKLVGRLAAFASGRRRDLKRNAQRHAARQLAKADGPEVPGEQKDEGPILDDSVVANKTYTAEMRKSTGDHAVGNAVEKMVGQDHKELTSAQIRWWKKMVERTGATGPEASEHERAPATGEAEGSVSSDGDARHAKGKDRTKAKKEEKTMEHAKKAATDKAAAEKSAAEKPAAKKALAVAGAAAAEKLAAEKAAAFAERSLPGRVATDKAAAEQAAAGKAVEGAAAATVAWTANAVHLEVPGPASDNRPSWRSWFSMLPSSAWAYLRPPLTTGSPGDEEKKAGEQDADDVEEQEQEMQKKQEIPKKQHARAETQKEQHTRAQTHH